MTTNDFCHWLQGYLELADPQEIKKEEIEMIKRHLELSLFLNPYRNNFGKFGLSIKPANC